MLRPSMVGTSILAPSAASTARHRYCDVDVVAFAPKQGMLADADDHIQIAHPAAVQPGIAFPRNADALPVAGARLDADLERFSALDAPFAVAHGAG